MKRGGPIARRTPLQARQALVRRGRLNRVTALSRQAPKPARRPVRTAEETRARELVAARSGGRCEVCGRAAATNWHHRRNRGQGGAWDPANGLHVCGSGTTGCHGAITVNPAIAYERGWSVRSTQDPAEQPVWLANRGWSYLTPDGAITPTERSAA